MKPLAIFTRARMGALVLAMLALLFAPRGRANAPGGRYTVADGTVTDNQTGLVWQQADDGNTYTFAAAQSHCAGLGGTWRVPTPKELLTLVDESRESPAIDTTAFPNTPATNFWTSAPSATNAGDAWFVDFNAYGTSYDYYPATNAFSVRCVH